MMALSCPFKEDCLALPLSAPLCRLSSASSVRASLLQAINGSAVHRTKTKERSHFKSESLDPDHEIYKKSSYRKVYYMLSMFKPHAMVLFFHFYVNVNKLCLNQIQKRLHGHFVIQLLVMLLLTAV